MDKDNGNLVSYRPSGLFGKTTTSTGVRQVLLAIGSEVDTMIAMYGELCGRSFWCQLPPARTSMTSAVEAALQISIGERREILSPGEQLEFGRAEGPGQISESSAVSSVHGVIAASDNSWSVRSTGRFHGFSVLDVETPSRLVIPIGAGPVTVPFARSVIAVEVEHHRYLLEVDAKSVAAQDWAGAWTSYLNRRPGDADADDDASSGTSLAWSGARFVDRSGRPLRWYQVLVAMCEPRLRLPASSREDRVPSNKEIATRLGVTVGVIENHHLDRLRSELGFPRFSEQMRLGAVLLAISQGIVTPADLVVLDQSGSP